MYLISAVILVKLAPPTVLKLVRYSQNISIHIQIFEGDMKTKTFKSAGHVESAVTRNGVRYIVTVDSQQLRDRNQTEMVNAYDN